MIGTITLNPSIDQHIFIENLVKDDSNRADRVVYDPGGKGINVSKVVQELGGRTRAYAPAGGDTGNWLCGLLRAEALPFCITPIRGQTRINTFLTDTDDHTQTRISAPGPTILATEFESFRRRLLAARPKPFVWVLSGSLSAGMKQDVYKKLILNLQKHSAPCVLDTDNDALRLGIEAKPFMIKPNEHEVTRLLGRKMRSIQDYSRAAQEILKKGVQVVVISLGKRGAFFARRTQRFHVAAPTVKVQSRIGAGDSLVGGFLWGLEKGMSFEEAACLGVAASASSVTTEGTQLCRRQDIPKLLPKVKVLDL